MHNRNFGWRLACAACITYAWRGWLHSCAWAKNFLAQSLSFNIDTQGRGVHGPDERSPAFRGKRLFTHNVKLYNCASGV